MIKDPTAAFKKKRVLLVGDTLIDLYMYGRSRGTALGSTVPRLEETKSVMNFGGNALIAANICELGGSVDFISCVGTDEDALKYKDFTHPRLTKHFFIDPSRRTTVKRRIFADDIRIAHFNSVDNHYLSPALEKKVLARTKKLIRGATALVVMDPQHGFLSPSLIKKLIALAEAHQVPLFADAQISHRKSNHHMYRGAYAMFLNEKEAKAVDPQFDSGNLKKSLTRIQKKFEYKNVIIKLGERGSVALCNNRLIATKPVKVRAVDPVGAGDAFLAAFALGDFEQLDETLKIANAWAALSTTVRGTTPPKRADLAKFVGKGGA